MKIQLNRLGPNHWMKDMEVSNEDLPADCIMSIKIGSEEAYICLGEVPDLIDAIKMVSGKMERGE